jgi:prepilin peptidase CpaA
MIATILFLVFPAAMVLAACLDAFTMTIPNRLTVAFALLFAPAAAFAGLPLAGIGLHLAAGAAMLAVAFGFFAMGWIGGGDAKFFAATALWLGWSDLLTYALYFSLIGGALTLAILAARAMPLPALLGRAEWALRLHNAKSGIPYGIALAAAGLIIYPATSWMQAFGAG